MDNVYIAKIPMNYFKSKEEYGLKLLNQESKSRKSWGESVVLYFMADQSRVKNIEELELQLRRIKVEVMIMSEYPNIQVKYSLR